ncbi:hypothetical protein K8I28_07310 [bacterium]|nr:hypothetical protein [bacterium]
MTQTSLKTLRKLIDQESNRILLFALFLAFLLALAGMIILQQVLYKQTTSSVNANQQVWAELTTTNLANSIDQQVYRLERELVHLAEVMVKVKRNSDLDLNEFERRGISWHRDGSEEQSEVLIFGDAAAMGTPKAAATSEEFDELVLSFREANPLINGVVLLDLQGVIRRVPANNFADHISNRYNLSASYLLKAASKIKAGEAGWMNGCEFVTHPMVAPYSILAPIMQDSVITGVIACEFDANKLLKTMNFAKDSWNIFLNRQGTIMAADSGGMEIFGAGQVSLQNHARREFNDLATRVIRRTNGSSVQEIDGMTHYFAFAPLEQLRWKIVSGVPESSSSFKKIEALPTLIVLGIVSLLLLGTVILLYYLIRRRSISRIQKVESYIEEIKAILRSILDYSYKGRLEDFNLEELVELSEIIQDLRKSTKTDQDEIVSTNMLMDAITDSNKIAVSIMNKRFSITYINNLAKKLFDNPGKGDPAHWLSYQAEHHGGVLASEAMSSRKVQHDLRELKVDGDERIFEAVYFPVFNAEERVIGFGEALKDVTGIHHLQRELAFKRQDIDRLEIEMKEHEKARTGSKGYSSGHLVDLLPMIRRKLTPIIGYASLAVESDQESAEKLLVNQSKIEESARSLLFQIESKADIAEIIEGEKFLTPGPFSINSLLQKMRGGMKQMCDLRSINLELKNREGSFALFTDETRLVKALYPLVENAVTYSTTGSIGLKIESREGKVHFQVSSSAQLDEMEYLGIVTDLMIETPLSPDFKFLGEGLKIAHAYARLLGGELELELHGQQREVVFILMVPRELKHETKKVDVEEKK